MISYGILCLLFALTLGTVISIPFSWVCNPAVGLRPAECVSCGTKGQPDCPPEKKKYDKMETCVSDCGHSVSEAATTQQWSCNSESGVCAMCTGSAACTAPFFNDQASCAAKCQHSPHNAASGTGQSWTCNNGVCAACTTACPPGVKHTSLQACQTQCQKQENQWSCNDGTGVCIICQGSSCPAKNQKFSKFEECAPTCKLTTGSYCDEFTGFCPICAGLGCPRPEHDIQLHESQSQCQAVCKKANTTGGSFFCDDSLGKCVPCSGSTCPDPPNVMPLFISKTACFPTCHPMPTESSFFCNEVVGGCQTCIPGVTCPKPEDGIVFTSKMRCFPTCKRAEPKWLCNENSVCEVCIGSRCTAKGAQDTLQKCLDMCKNKSGPADSSGSSTMSTTVAGGH